MEAVAGVKAEPVVKTNKLQALVLGLQHVLAMYSGGILVPLLIGAALHFTPQQMAYLISADIFMTGIGTLLQLKSTRLTGIAMPVVLGSAIQSVSPLINIGGTLGIGAMYGATISAGVFVFLIAGLFARLREFFPPVVTGSLITVIGFALIPVGIQNLGGGDVAAKSFGSPANLAIGTFTIAIIVLVSLLAKGFTKAISILLGIVLGTAFAAILGKVSLAPVAAASWFHLPTPFFLGVPTFHSSAIITMIIIALTSMIESTGVYFALADLTGRKLTNQDMAKGYRAEGLAVVLSGLFNTFPYSTFSQNVGVVRLSGVKTKQPIYYAAVILILIGLLPKFGALATIIPTSVLGGAMIVLFGTIGIQGTTILRTVDFGKERNLMIAAISIGAGIGVTVYPQIFQQLPELIRLVIENAVVVTSVLAVFLNIVLPGREKEEVTAS
ncbi:MULTISPECIES: nucleobase:cation symporter-2 family protein [Bacilli]|uniref:nucleobase:cation symporter-2 family protein n=1 Tax=Bacilli TaxID=91061 RepID=UPI00119320BA|nr:nucleobase:cation symporter-2 family protein [Weissella cibaria]MCS8561956.1 purine permease [Weissella cibaria]MCS8564405.1 purine permease [Weissella cibaria]MCS8577179.1 purine permease [Weissella cibaria]MCT0000508.1 purine permease [Weissella cibaria]MDK9678351.1 nucleobase:cation symporter-2 family protein [Weissella cibaria]